MRIGVPKEIKAQESRVGLTPDSVKVLISNGHEVLVENNSGFEAGFDNDQYKKAGAKIVNQALDIFNDSEIIVKVKEPLNNEIKMIKENQIVFTYLHLAAAKELTEGLVKSKSICTFQLDTGLQISGIPMEVLGNKVETFYRFEGPVQLSYNNKQLEGHGGDYHCHGFSSPLCDSDSIKILEESTIGQTVTINFIQYFL